MCVYCMNGKSRYECCRVNITENRIESNHLYYATLQRRQGDCAQLLGLEAS